MFLSFWLVFFKGRVKLVKAIMAVFFNHKSLVVKFIRLHEPIHLFLAFKLKHDIFLDPYGT